jgi:hypothetical protein
LFQLLKGERERDGAVGKGQQMVNLSVWIFFVFFFFFSLLLFNFFLVYLSFILGGVVAIRGEERKIPAKWVKCGWNIEENEVLLTRLTLTILHYRWWRNLVWYKVKGKNRGETAEKKK